MELKSIKDTLRADPDYLSWWDGLLESEAFKKTYWKDVEPSGFKSFKEMSSTRFGENEHSSQIPDYYYR